jgi:hypothetical protein
MLHRLLETFLLLLLIHHGFNLSAQTRDSLLGGGSGIGLMAAQALAANGAKVYITIPTARMAES